MRERQLLLAHGAELGSVLEGLLEVVADDVRALVDAAAGRIVDPVCEPLVKLRPQALRGRAVSGLLDQDVRKRKSSPPIGAGAGG